VRITYKGDYALKTILDLALNYNNGVVTIHDLAKRLDIPVKFLEQVLLNLKKGGFVESRRGKIGGYLLAKHPAKIKVGDVVRFVEGYVEPIACIENGYKGCRDLYRCAFRPVWQRVDEATKSVIDSVNFEELVEKARANRRNFVYSI